MTKPTVGRIVHYTPERPGAFPGPRAALVVFVADITQSSRDPEEDGMPLVNLKVFHPDVDAIGSLNLGVRFSKVPTPGYWSWPPRV
jgi:hypothetical protein